NWIKRVLFLADRNALVTQAKNNFSEYLPELSSIDLTAEKENNTTRLVFSTYPTMMNLIDKVHSEEGRFYGVGHFDLIIIDEAHRSVYNKYGAIFEYFDSLIVGLTATPKDSIDHNTYELFDCPSGDPTFSFGLDEAVPKYLVPYRNINVSTQFLRNGIKYNELSEEDQAKYEEEFRDNDTGIFPEEIASSELNKWLFNIDTVNKVLDTLMNDGLKIEGGDKIGRTIIFAVNQNHARFIEECFQKRFPQYPSGFISMIHNKVSHAQSLIEAFCDHYKENLPQIAISVDMMDTGVDAPRVLNLVFFKPVRSYAKFWQMIGRGTRLCPDAFGPEMPKEEFLIFDVYQNFNFFEIQKN
ncbi:MAG: DEAD/DEAH box helicase family protein, partial [Marinoscillum sp.]